MPLITDDDRRLDESHPTDTDPDAGDDPPAPTTARPFCVAPSCWRPGAPVELEHDDTGPVVLCAAHAKDYRGTSS